MRSLTEHHDVVVVGARAAGAGTALLLARLGYDVVLVDRAVFPADTLSTHQIARLGVVALHRWGVLPALLASGVPAIRQVTFTAGGESVSRTIKHKAGVGLLVAPRRHILDTIVTEAATANGADVRMGVTVTRVNLDDTGRAIGIRGHDRTGSPFGIDARFVVGADGLGSKVARAVGAGIVEDRGGDGAVQYAYYSDVAWQGIELIAADRALAGVFPTHNGEACVWVATPSIDARAARRRSASRAEAFTTQLQRAAPELMERLRTGRCTSGVAGMLHSPNHLRRAYGPGWALVGDAGYHRDAVTGHGISDAYRDAELLASALHQTMKGCADERTALAGYQRQRDQELRDVFELTCAMARYPPVIEFVELQKRLARAIDVEATALAARTVPGEPALGGAHAARAANSTEGEPRDDGQRLDTQRRPGRADASRTAPQSPPDP